MTQALMAKAEKALAFAEVLLGIGDTDGAVNRAYYAMFEASTAALASTDQEHEQTRPKTHAGLIGSVGQRLVKTGKLTAEAGRAQNRVQELRLMADYLTGSVPIEDARRALQDAGSFIEAVAMLLTQPK